MKKQELFIEEGTPIVDESMSVEVLDNGPYVVRGDIPIREYFVEADKRNIPVDYRVGEKNFGKNPGPVYLCRCGHTKTPPYCDGTHQKIGFRSIPRKETRSVVSQAEVYDGKDILMTDNDRYCSFSRFCDVKNRIWNMISDTSNPNRLEESLEVVSKCPSGRLKLWKKENNEPLEVHYAPEIGLIEDMPLGGGGPLWVKGGIPIRTSDGFAYERRNRVTLCRCGKSENAPFCDGSHAAGR